MSEEQTPLQVLEDAVAEFVRATGDDGTVNAWVLGYQLSTIVDHPDVIPLAYRSDYALGWSTSGELAIGLAHFTASRLQHELLDAYADDDPE